MTSRPSTPLTLRDTPSVISSPELADGALPSDLPDGPMTDLFGRVVVPVSPLVARESLGGGAIRAIFGQRGIASSASAALQSSLVSRLKARLPTGGSTLFAMTWNEKATPSGRLVSLLQASALRTSDSGYGSLPTVTARDWRWGMSQANVERRKQHPRGVNLNEFMQRELGRPGRLNPGMVCLLMGFPTSWVKCAALVTPSSRKSRRHLSPPIKR